MAVAAPETCDDAVRWKAGRALAVVWETEQYWRSAVSDLDAAGGGSLEGTRSVGPRVKQALLVIRGDAHYLLGVLLGLTRNY